ncbi:MAG: molybdopterin-guanine dinucleotide biosynthesis protein B [Candidatus Bipolaricaulota bacterium]|nr:molybdopterin-guanine dinucleotide biosynthesis protein B [Candidatus Bipolaricaulota bacterium]
MVPTLAFIGHQDSGKTTLLTQLIPILLGRGYRVGTVKHTPHEAELDQSGKDSFRHRRAGAVQTLVVSSSEYVLFGGPRPEETIQGTIDRLFVGLDLVLAEGFKHGPFPKIEVYRSLSHPLLAGQIEVLAVVTDQKLSLPAGIPLLSPGRPERIVWFIEESFL